MPSHITAEAGRITPLPPPGKTLGGKESQRLVLAMRKNELKQARIARQAIAFHRSQQRFYARKGK